MMMRLLSSFVLVLVSVAVWAGAFEITPKQAHELRAQGKSVIIDVREHAELKSGMAKGALWFPYSKIKNSSEGWKSFVKKLDKSKKVIFYCAAGGRAGRVVSELDKAGFDTANMGGFRDWQKSGLPVSHSPPEQ